jgi:protein involved in polysaccharide export with SLBB domain/capsular polysaccharide biosynthesis protein
MKDNSNATTAAFRRREENESSADQGTNESGRVIKGTNGPGSTHGQVRPQGVKLLSVMDLVLQRWHWLVLGAACGATGLYLAGLQLVKPKFTANAKLMRYEAPGKSEAFKTVPVSGDTFAAIISAPELLQEVCRKAVPPMAPDIFAKSIKIDPDPDSDVVTIQLAGRDPHRAVEVLNLYITNAVEYTRSLEAKQASTIANEYLKKQVTEVDNDISYLEEQFRKMPMGQPLTHKLVDLGSKVNSVSTNLATTEASMMTFSRESQRLTAAQAELFDLLQKYTEAHPSVKAKQQEIQDLQHDLAKAPTNFDFAPLAATTTRTGPDGPNPELDVLTIKMRTLEDSRQDLIKRQREAELYMTDPPGNVRVFAPANLATIKTNHRRVKIAAGTMVGAFLGFGGSLLLILFVEFMDNRLKTADDVTRVTKLPVLTSLGDLNEMDANQRAQWAFRTWTMLQGRLSPSANFGLVCGITSSAPGEGRSTFVSLLAEAASMTGFRVLTIATKPSSTPVPPNHQLGADASPDGESKAPEINPGSALTTSVLSSPAQVTEKLTGPNSQPMVHIPLPGWVWNLERRKQWREALNQWRQIDNLVIFVELPPACVPEAVLLGSNLPNMLWLSESGAASAPDTQAQLETLRHARCNLVGAVLNKEPGMPLRKRLPRWLGCLAILLALSATYQSNAQTQGLAATPENSQTNFIAAEDARDTRTNLSFSVVNPSQRAAWQQHLTLGPGDVLTLSLFGSPDLTRTEVAVGPDGRISYLEAQDVMASGLTIDELRAKLDEAMGQYRRAPHTIVIPVAFKSKKYFMLGKVTTKGVYTMERPLTVLEALARAHGLENALVDRNLVNLTDFHRSFVARAGKRIPLNFEKLFQQGDLGENIQVEPGDYIYFAPGDLSEVYVVGEVRLAGPVAWTPDLTIIGAISGRGGFTERAYRARVLVIRGSLSAPEAIPVDTHAILDAKELNFKLRPHDIIYVNSRPFIKIEEAADLGATAFIQSIITSWVGVDVVKPIQ